MSGRPARLQGYRFSSAVSPIASAIRINIRLYGTWLLLLLFLRLMLRFVALLLAIVAWQALFCAVATEGKMTGLFEIGSGQARPPEPQDRVYVFPNSSGYDGQIYRVIARDP